MVRVWVRKVDDSGHASVESLYMSIVVVSVSVSFVGMLLRMEVGVVECKWCKLLMPRGRPTRGHILSRHSLNRIVICR